MEDEQSSREIAEAMRAERSAWLAVAHRLPGTEDHDPVLWSTWVAATRRLAATPTCNVVLMGSSPFYKLQPEGSNDGL